VVINDSARLLKTPPFQIAVDGAGKNILEAIVFRTVVFAVHGAILWIHSARAHHEFFGERMLRHIHPDILWKRSGSEIAQEVVPITGKCKQSTVELFRFGVLTSRRKGGIAVAVHYFYDFPILNSCRAMPGLHNESVMRGDVAEQNDLIVGAAFRGAIFREEHFADGRHPSTYQAVHSFALQSAASFGKELHGMVGSGTAVGEHRHRIGTFFRTHEGIPRQTPAWPFFFFRSLRRRS